MHFVSYIINKKMTFSRVKECNILQKTEVKYQITYDQYKAICNLSI